MKNGAASSAPFFTTRNVPPCSATNTRPSGTRAIAVGEKSPVARGVSVKPGGKVAAPSVAAAAMPTLQMVADKASRKRVTKDGEPGRINMIDLREQVSDEPWNTRCVGAIAPLC
jgi:hypothetical protein